MQARQIAIFGWRVIAAFFLGSLLLVGNAVADAKKGVPTKLVPLKPAEPPKAVPVTPVVAVPPKKPQCVLVRRTVVTESPGQTVYVPGIAASICGCCGQTQLWMPGVFASVPSSETVTTSYEEVCQ